MEDHSKAQTIVIIEDNEALAEIYKTRLEMLGYVCFIAYNGITGLYFVQKELPDLVLLDLMIPDIDGGHVLETMRGSAWGKDIKVVVISNLNESEAPSNLRELGISAYVVKANVVENQIDQIVQDTLAPSADVKPAPNDYPEPTDMPVAPAPPQE